MHGMKAQAARTSIEQVVRDDANPARLGLIRTCALVGSYSLLGARQHERSTSCGFFALPQVRMAYILPLLADGLCKAQVPACSLKCGTFNTHGGVQSRSAPKASVNLLRISEVPAFRGCSPEGDSMLARTGISYRAISMGPAG